MRYIKKTLLIYFSAVLLLSVFTPVASAATPEEIYRDHTGYTMVASRKGYFSNAPENSLRSIEDAVKAGADIVEIDVKQTADGVLILMEDDTVERTCCGETENTVVSEMTYDEIYKLNLLSGEGGHGASETEEKVPTLEEVFRTDLDCLYMLDADWSLRDKISNLAIEYGMLGSIIFYIDDAKTDKIAQWKKTLPEEPMVMTYFKGNVIFAATSFIKNTAGTAQGVHLATKNPYGVIFGETVQNTAHENGIRTMATPCIPELCGTEMQDTAVWWDELISRGFNIIMTDCVPELREYVDRTNSEALGLQQAKEKYIDGWQLPDFDSDKFFDYKLAYTNAAEKVEELLSKDMSRASGDISTACYELKKAYDDINRNYAELQEGTAGKTVTPLTVFLAILAVALISAAEIYVYKKKKR